MRNLQSIWNRLRNFASRTMATLVVLWSMSLMDGLAEPQVFSINGITSDFTGSRRVLETGVPGVVGIRNNGVLTMQGVMEATNDEVGHSLATLHWRPDHVISDGDRLEYRVDVLEVSSPDVRIGMHFSPREVAMGYTVYLDGFELTLTKWGWTGEGRWGVDHLNTIAEFIHDEVSIKQHGITLSMALTQASENLWMTIKVLDKDDNGKVLYSKTVVDTPEVDETTLDWPGFEHLLTPDIPSEPLQFFDRTSAALYVGQITDGTKPSIKVVYDNFTWEYTGAEISSITRGVQIAWPAMDRFVAVEAANSPDGPWVELEEPVVRKGALDTLWVPAEKAASTQLFRLVH